MAKFDIWVEGYAVQGSSGKAHILAKGVEAETFKAAVLRWYNALAAVSDVKEMYGELDTSESIPTLWGCKLFDNYDDAAKTFG